VGHSLTAVGQLQSSVSGYAPFIGNRKSSDGNIAVFKKDGTTVGSIGVSSSDNLYIAGQVASHAGLTFGTNQIIPLSQGGSGDNTVDLGNNGNYFKDVLVKGGIRFGTNTSANYLDDYEEGTWTPVDGSGAGLTFTVTSATYTKVGNLVHARCHIVYPSTASASNAQIGGLPFTTASAYQTGSIYTNESTFQQIEISPGSTSTYLYTDANAFVTNATMSTNFAILSLTYYI